MVSARIRVPRTRGCPDTLPSIRSTSSQPVQSMSQLAFVTLSRLAMRHSLLSGYAKRGPASSRSSRSAISSTPSRGCKGLHVSPEWTPPAGSLLILRAARRRWRRESRAWRSRGGCGWIPSWLPTCSPSRRRGRTWGRSVRSSWLRSPSAASLLAIQHAGDFQVVTLVAKENAVVLGSQAHQGRLDIAKLLCVPLAGLGITRQRLEGLQGDGLLNAVNVWLGLLGPDDPPTHCVGVLLPATVPCPSCPNRPWSGRTPQELPHSGSVGYASTIRRPRRRPCVRHC